MISDFWQYEDLPPRVIEDARLVMEYDAVLLEKRAAQQEQARR